MGAKHLYANHLRPFLLRHQARLDHIVGVLYSEMAKFVSAHQGELQFAKTLLMKILVAAKHGVNGIFHLGQRKANSANRAIEGPARVEEQGRSEIEGRTPQLATNSESENDE